MSLKFTNRADAGRQLAERLAKFDAENPVVLALPRGGVPVGYEIAEALDAPLDVILVRKLGAPGFSELGIGAVAEGPSPQVILNEEVMERLQPSTEHVENEKIRQLEVLDMRRKIYRQGRPPPDIAGRTVIVVDDGVATGGTAAASLAALSQSGAARLVLAVPVAPSEVLERLATKADEIVTLATPDPFRSVGEHYEDFAQLTDDDVIEVLLKSAERRGGNARQVK